MKLKICFCNYVMNWNFFEKQLEHKLLSKPPSNYDVAIIMSHHCICYFRNRKFSSLILRCSHHIPTLWCKFLSQSDSFRFKSMTWCMLSHIVTNSHALLWRFFVPTFWSRHFCFYLSDTFKCRESSF